MSEILLQIFRSLKAFSTTTRLQFLSTTPLELVSPVDLINQWQEEVEDLEGYHVGGYHPVHLQDEYSDRRYRIVHKIGFGTYSTVWLAKEASTNWMFPMEIARAIAVQAIFGLQNIHSCGVVHGGR